MTFNTGLFGSSIGTVVGSQNAAMQNASYNSMLQNAQMQQVAKVHGLGAGINKRIFVGNLEVVQVANGYTVNIGTKEGYEYVTHIARSIVEVNEIIAAAMVAFQLDSK